MNQILNTNDAVFPEVVFDDLVVGEGDTLSVDLTVAALVDELTDSLEIRVAVGDVWLDDLEHFIRGLCEANEDTVVNL